MERPVERIDVEAVRTVARDLTQKYERLLELRLTKLRTGAMATRAELADLAGHYPGALRELDRLPLATLQRRLRALTRVQEDEEQRPAFWMTAQYMYHRELRGALFCKAWLARKWPMEAYADAASRSGCAETARTYAAIADVVVSPPKGRITELVIARIAAELDTSPSKIRRAVTTPKLVKAARAAPDSAATTFPTHPTCRRQLAATKLQSSQTMCRSTR